jgi:hypothetical protein
MSVHHYCYDYDAPDDPVLACVWETSLDEASCLVDAPCVDAPCVDAAPCVLASQEASWEDILVDGPFRNCGPEL